MGDRRTACGVRLDGFGHWPSPDDPAEVQWHLRNGTDSEKAQFALQAASFVAAYCHLIGMTAAARAKVVRRIKAVCKADPIGGQGNG